MAESFAGITIPAGEPTGLRDSARSMRAAAAGLRDETGELEGMPTTLGSWQGPASGSYAVACLSQSEALGRIAEGWTLVGVGELYATAEEAAEPQAEMDRYMFGAG